MNSRRCVMASSLSWTRTSSHRPEGLQEPKAISEDAQETIQKEQVDHEQVAEKRRACDVAKIDTNFAKQSGCVQEHTAQREVVAVEEQQKLVSKSLEIQV